MASKMEISEIDVFLAGKAGSGSISAQSLHLNGAITSAVHPTTDIDERSSRMSKRAIFRRKHPQQKQQTFAMRTGKVSVLQASIIQLTTQLS